MSSFGPEVLKHFWLKKKNLKTPQRFLNCTKSQNVTIPPNHTLLTRTESVFMSSTNFCQLFLPPCPHFACSLLLPNKFILRFISKRAVLFLFSHLQTNTNPSIFSDAMPQALILCLYLYYRICVAWICYPKP